MKCIKCGQQRDGLFPVTASPFFPNHTSPICSYCYDKAVNRYDLDNVDRMCRQLDIPFDPKIWMSVATDDEPHPVTEYLRRISTEGYHTKDSWADVSSRWAKIRAERENDEIFESFSDAKKKELKERWSDDYSNEDLKWLEAFYNRILATQNVSTPILDEYAKDLCEIELQIKKGLRNGEDVKRLFDAKDNIIKIANFTPSNSRSAASFESTGELMAYLQKKGFHPTLHNEPQDSIDFMMENLQGYSNRIMASQGNIADLVDEKRESYNLSKRLEANDDNYGRYNIAAEPTEFEDAEDFEADYDLKGGE